MGFVYLENSPPPPQKNDTFVKNGRKTKWGGGEEPCLQYTVPSPLNVLKRGFKCFSPGF